ncbi:MAG: acetoacetate--CoA ligase [Candidatus Marinimicrobia bacterium]|nr:acetoacetate--CoA ligase [Candidatus Neomarinimicrobiota bacterium]MBT7944822.1 acetoacetate--CoA ligase [Candidatus Neomarinimicrobiota bacterium]
MDNILWKPLSPEKTQMVQLMNRINEIYGLKMKSYDELFNWSVNHISEFWAEVWNFADIKYSLPYSEVVDDSKKMPGAKWFAGAKLNYAENLLRYRDDKIAIHFKGEGQPLRSLTYEDLFNEVEKLAHSLKESGVQKGDRICGFIPNIPEAIIAMLATASIGAIWSSSSPDFGIKGVLDRFIQIEPIIIFAANGYFYNGKTFDSLDKLQGILNNLPSVEKVVVVEYTEENPDLSQIENGILYSDFISNSPYPLEFEQLPFDHPLYIMYSSGTTGLPKSIVHSAGGTLIQHLKELRFHCDLTRDDTIFYFTTCGWMMWNWLVSSLAVGSTVVLFDGSPFHPDGKAMWHLADELEISIFGASAKFIEACKDANIRPIEIADLSKLRAVLSTGSPLVDESFDYVYEHVKTDVLLGSISGGTDIISCFALGNPMLPVRRGELQCRGLGMDVQAFDAKEQAMINEKGELVCTSAFPSMPIYFWNDPDGEKYHKAYFTLFQDIWHHGDFIRISEHGGIKIFGRSDATLNPGGVRIGTAEIYRVVEALDFIKDSLVIGQKWEGDERVVLFLKMKEGSALNDELIKEIKSQIRSNCSPRHVPAKILMIKEIPYTINGKKVEIAVRKIIHGQDVTNKDALANPDSLELFKEIPELQV